MEIDDFQSTTEAFLAWLSSVGVRINPKMALKDLRSEGRGRGVGKFSFSLGFLQVRIYPVRMRSACGLGPRCLLGSLHRLLWKGKYANISIVAAADFEEDEVVFCIPRSAVLNVNNVFAGQETSASKKALLQMPSWLVRTLFLLRFENFADYPR
jgi:SET domain-containing protein 6